MTFAQFCKKGGKANSEAQRAARMEAARVMRERKALKRSKQNECQPASNGCK